MEQYELPRGEEYQNLRLCLDRMKPLFVMARWVGALGGGVILRERLEGKGFDVKETETGLSVIVDNCERYVFSIDEDWDKRSAIAYEREPEVHLPTGVNPDDRSLPPVKYSVFRKANMEQYFEITFEGKAPLRFHSAEDGWRFWYVDAAGFGRK